jgi:D-threo-aldose 1-dehydrogenase
MDPLRQRAIGRTGLAVTCLGLGGAPLGRPEIGDEQAVETVRAALGLGVRLLDTAPLYGRGASEARFGRALAGVARDSYVIATKVGRRLPVDLPPGERPPGSEVENLPFFDFSYDATLRVVEASLRRLGLDRIDILHIHDPDAHEAPALEGAYRALRRLKEEGVCRAIGAGMNQAEMPARFARAAEFDCFLLAGRYTLLDQIGLRELLPLCAERGISIIIGGPYNSGILATGALPGATYNYQPAPPALLEKTARIQAVCDRYGVPLRAAALQFPLAHPAVAAVIPGAVTPAEAEDNLAMLRWSIPPALWTDLRDEGLIDAAAPLPAVA